MEIISLKDTVYKYISPSVFKNSGWLILDKLVAAAISFIVYFVVANYLGPEGLGIYNYAFSVVSLVSTFGLLGLDSLVVKDLIDNKFDKKIVLGTLLGFRAVGSILVIILSGLIVWLSKGSFYISVIAIILASLYLFRSTQVIDNWFLSEKKVSPSVIARIIGCVASALLKILFIVLKLDILYFSIATTLEFVVGAIILVILYKKVSNEGICTWKFDFIYWKDLLRRGWVLVLGSFFIAIVSRFDQYLLGTIKDNLSVGIYSPAAKISEFWYYVPLAFLDAVYPSLIEAKKKGEEIFLLKLERVASVLSYVGLGFCLFITIFSNLIIKIFLNSSYSGAEDILRIYVWGTLGMVLISLWGRWLIMTGKQNQLIIVQILTSVSNIALNLILVPQMGTIGGAWANAICYNISFIFVITVLNKGQFIKIFLSSIFNPFKIALKKS